MGKSLSFTDQEQKSSLNNERLNTWSPIATDT